MSDDVPEERRCAACGCDLRDPPWPPREGERRHDKPCQKPGCNLLWALDELDGRGVCPVCTGALGLFHPERERPDPRSAFRAMPGHELAARRREP